MRKRSTMVAACAAVILGATWGFVNLQSVAQDKPRRSDDVDHAERKQFMRGKLAMVQKIVEGIATEDFGLVEKGGNELLAIAETSAWKSTGDRYYADYSGSFEQAARGLIESAKSKSVEKATFAYVHVTFSCTACHQHVRNVVRVAR